MESDQDEAKKTIKLNDDYELSNPTCLFCNGYYGSCFEEPVCAICHLFLFPREWNLVFPLPIFTEKTDDEDSGNDEPNEHYLSQGSNQSPAQANYPSSLPTPPQYGPLEKRNSPNIGPSDEVSSGLIQALPPEVLLLVFSFLDDMSLWSASSVCHRWRHVIQSSYSDNIWREYVSNRFPIFAPFYSVKNWFNVYSTLMLSSPCKMCLFDMSLKTLPHGEENSWRRNRLRIELKSLQLDPPQGIRALPLDSKYCHWQASITGPVGSPYEGGNFYVYVQVPYSYPMEPPIVKFLTKIFHPNVSRHGDVGLDSITHNWSLALTISKILVSIQSLLTDPFCEICMEPEVGSLYMENKDFYVSVARAWTWKYAMHDVVQPRI